MDLKIIIIVVTLYCRAPRKNCAPLLCDTFLYPSDSEFLDRLIKERKKLVTKFTLYTVVLMTSLSSTDLRNSILTCIQNKLLFLRPQNLLLLLVILNYL